MNQYLQALSYSHAAQSKPWVVVKLGAVDEPSQIVARYANRQDAEDSCRFLRKAMVRVPNIHFLVCFDTGRST